MRSTIRQTMKTLLLLTLTTSCFPLIAAEKTANLSAQAGVSVTFPPAASGLLAALKADGLEAKPNQQGDIVELRAPQGHGPVAAELWARLRAKPALRKFSGSKVSRDDIRELAGFPELAEVMLGGHGDYGDEDFVWFGKMRALRYLKIHHTTGIITGAGMEHLVNLPQLKRIEILNTWVDPVLKAGPNPPHLFGDAAYPFFARMAGLEELDLTAVHDSTPDGLRSLSASRSLRILKVDRIAPGPLLEAIADIKSLRFLEVFLSFERRPATDAECSALAQLGHLDTLILYNASITAEQLTQLQSKLPHTDIELRHRDGAHGEGERDTYRPKLRERTAIR